MSYRCGDRLRVEVVDGCTTHRRIDHVLAQTRKIALNAREVAVPKQHDLHVAKATQRGGPNAYRATSRAVARSSPEQRQAFGVDSERLGLLLSEGFATGPDQGIAHRVPDGRRPSQEPIENPACLRDAFLGGFPQP